MEFDNFHEIAAYVDNCTRALRGLIEPSDNFATSREELFELLLALEESVTIAEAIERLRAGKPSPNLRPEPSRFLACFFEPLNKKKARSKYLWEYRQFRDDSIAWHEIKKLIASRSRENEQPIRPPNTAKFGGLPRATQAELGRYLIARDEHAKRLRAWRTELSEFERLFSRCLRKHLGNELIVPGSAERRKVVARQRISLEHLFSQGVPLIQRLSWKILPAGAPLSDSINHYLVQARGRFPTRAFADGRLRLVATLEPARCFIGTDEFDGYIVFFFENCKVCVLECPWVGNALYLLDAEKWTELAKLSKAELLSNHRRHVDRIVHDEHGAWFEVLKRRISMSKMTP